MGVKRVEELQVWQRAKTFADEVSALLATEPFQRDRPLREQLNDSSTSPVSNIAEGFGQQSDRAFARYLYTARGSNSEAKTQLAVALGRGYLSREECTRLAEMSDEIGRMLTGLIAYLHRVDRKRRP
jgi:four helix bundle protein